MPPLQIFQDKEHPEDWRVEDTTRTAPGPVRSRSSPATGPRSGPASMRSG
jgi:hypothetical protein